MRFAENNKDFAKMQFIDLKGEDWVVKQRYAGKVVAKCLETFRLMVANTNSLNLKDIELECEKIIHENDCVATFKGYKGFPGAVCLSVNKDMVHGIPKDYVLQSGDLVTLDLGATYEGAISDAALTVICGRPKNKKHENLVYQCEEALYKGIKSIAIGNQIGCIGNAIHQYNKSQIDRFGLITNYGGHGLSWNKPHSQPFVLNKSNKNEGIRITPGLTVAIEPMLTIGPVKTKKSKDKWTISTQNINSHAEHTIFVHNDHVEIMTWRKHEQNRCPNRLYFDKKTTTKRL